MLPNRFLRRPVVAALLLLLALPVAPIAAQTPTKKEAPPTRGLDIVLLVDVSLSMYDFVFPPGLNKTNLPGKGSDPERVRWDVAKLVLDALTEEDRVAVVPFNHEAPAKYLGREDAYVPGRLPFEVATVDAVRGRLAAKLRQFAGGDGVAGNGPRGLVRDPQTRAMEFNGANGMTRLLHALSAAGKLLKAAKDSAGANQQRVILLTDGVEYSKSPDLRIINSGAWVNDPRFVYFKRSKIPIDVIGLGAETSQAAEAFRNRLAQETQGAYTYSGTSQEFMEAVRNRIWSYKNVWFRSHRVPAGKSEKIRTETLGGISDLAVVVNEERKPRDGSAQFRTAYAPDQPPALRWIVPDTAPRTLERKARSHLYYYFDGRQQNSDRLGQVFRANPKQDLEISLPASAYPRHVHLAKRTIPNSLFRVKLAKDWFFRHEPLAITVEMEKENGAEHFSPEQFEVRAELRRSGAAADSRAIRSVLTLQEGTREFRTTDPAFTATDLQSTGGDQDYYNLYVSVVGKEPKMKDSQGFTSHSLIRYQFNLPIKTITIENAVPIKPQRVELALTRRYLEREGKVLPQFPLPADEVIDLKPDYRRPTNRKTEKPLEAPDLTFRWAGTDSDRQLMLRRLGLTVQLKLSKRITQTDAEFTSGAIQLVAVTRPNKRNQVLRIVDARGYRPGSGANGYTIPFDILLKRIGIRISPDQVEFKVGPDKAEEIAKLKVAAINGDDQSVGPVKLSLTPLKPDAAVQFTADELWLQLPDKSDSRGQTLTVAALGTEFELHFRPQAKRFDKDPRMLVGIHDYQLKAEGDAYNTALGTVRLEVEPPRLRVKPVSTVRLQTYPGNPDISAQFQARLEWLPEGSWTYLVAPGPDRPFKIPCVTPGQSDKQLTIQYGNLSPQLKLTAAASGAAADSGWKPIAPKFKIVDTEVEGFHDYRCALQIRDRDQQVVQTLTVDLALDGLKLAGPYVPESQRAGFPASMQDLLKPVPLKGKLPLVQLLGQSAEYMLVITNQRGTHLKLKKEHVQVQIAGPRPVEGKGVFLTSSDEKRFDVHPPPTIGTVQVAPKGEGFLVPLQFKKAVNAYPDVAYHLKLQIRYADSASGVDLGSQSLQVKVLFVEATKLTRANLSGGGE